MQALRLFKLWCYLAIVALILIPASMLLLDEPVAGFWMRTVDLSDWGHYAPSSRHLGEAFLLAAAAVLPVCLFARRIPAWTEAVLISAMAVAASYYIAEHFLKPFFFNPQPLLFLDRLRNLLGSHGRASGGFPSTHGAMAAAASFVAWVYFTQARRLIILGLAVIDFLMVTGRWHYLSDVLAGNMLGATIAMLVCEAGLAIRTLRTRHIQ